MRIPYFRVNAFTSAPFAGNPAGVCALERWLPDALMQSIAAENALSETAFFVRQSEDYELRWFTPTVEVDLCGHATLASALVLFSELGYSRDVIQFQTRSGPLSTRRRGELLELDFPSRPPEPCDLADALVQGLGKRPVEVFRSRDYLAVFEKRQDVAELQPDMALLSRLDSLGVIATAPGVDEHFVSRFFAPRAGVPEDPVTGSAHCTLIPFWSERLRRTDLFARQISKRGGELYCRNLGERVGIGGKGRIYSRGEIEV